MPFALREHILSRIQHVRRLKAIESPFSWLSKAGTIPLHAIRLLSRTPVLLWLFVVAAVLVAGSLVTPPMSFLPAPDDAGVILGTLLTAQAAIAALTLAVTLFMMQGIQAKREVDDRMYREHVRRSWMQGIFWASLLAVAVTGVLLLIEGVISGDGTPSNVKPDLRNFVLAAGLAFLLNLVLAVVLFERAILHASPAQWLALRRGIIKSDMREAIQVFLRREHRALEAREAGELDFTVWFPDQGEGSADEAIRALLDDARRAMSERRHEEFSRSLDFVRELVVYAMEEIKKTGIQWGAPGTQPHWPPLRELSSNLYSFRKDVIREGDRDYILELLRFDYMLTVDGVREGCGELFTVGLSGYRWNYQIVNRIGSVEFREMLRDRSFESASSFHLGKKLEEIFQYAREMVRHQERLLSEAMHSDRPGDYDQLHRLFQAWFNAMRFNWKADDWPPSEASRQYQLLEQEYRIALMGLAGRAILLAKDNRIVDANPYLDVARLVYSQLGPLGDDLAQALSYVNSPGFFLWEEWETEDAIPYRSTIILTERYPLLFFTLRLMELSSNTMPTFNLHGRAQRTLDWFMNNSELVGAYVRAELELALEQRRELSTEALRSAVRRDEVTEDYEIIGRELSEARVAAVKSEVYDAAFSENSVERLFARAGVSLCLSEDAADAPEELAFRHIVPKAYLTDGSEGALTYYAPLTGDQWGRALSHDVLQRFCEALEGAPDILATLDTPTALLQGIDRAIENLGAPEHVVVVLAGNWFDLQFGLETANSEGYEADWTLPESDRLGEIGRYRGHSILNARDYNGRCVYVVDPAGWGHFVRAKTDGDEDLRVEIRPISIDRARELLTANPDQLADQPDEESKLRKLQTCVEIVIGARTGFRVADASHARRVTPIHQPEIDTEAP